MTIPAPFDRYRSVVPDPEGFARCLARPLPPVAWANPLRVAPERLAELLAADGFAPEAIPWMPGAFRLRGPDSRPGRHWTWFAGLCQTQEAAAMTPVAMAGPGPGMRALDLCAGPGNKTAQMAAAMENGATVIANDVTIDRLRPIRETADRLGLINVCVTRWDGAAFPEAAGRYDRVLADVPCGGEGVSRKYPDRPFRNPPGRLAEKQGLNPPGRLDEKQRLNPPGRLAEKQRLLLDRAIGLCRPGGRIIYATCTYAPEENEAVVDWALARHAGALAMRPARLEGLAVAPGLCRWNGARFHPDLEMSARIWPHLNDTGGFFVAILEKTAETPPLAAAGPAPAPVSEFGAEMTEAGHLALAIVSRRYGMDLEAIPGVRLRHAGGRSVMAAAADHRPAPLPEAAYGLPVARISKSYVKLSTAGAMAFGHLARRNWAEIDAARRDAYMARRPFHLTAGQAQACEGDGDILIRHAGFVIGTGRYHRLDRRVESHFPGRWAPRAAVNMR